MVRPVCLCLLLATPRHGCLRRLRPGCLWSSIDRTAGSDDVAQRPLMRGRGGLLHEEGSGEMGRSWQQTRSRSKRRGTPGGSNVLHLRTGSGVTDRGGAAVATPPRSIVRGAYLGFCFSVRLSGLESTGLPSTNVVKVYTIWPLPPGFVCPTTVEGSYLIPTT